jgi:hypothetical protein
VNRTGAVTLSVVCHTSRDRSDPGTRHDITLLADGSIRTPHDLESERLAVALGGFLSCVELVDRTAPVFWEWLALQQRLGGPPIRSRDEGRRWTPTARAACCARGGYETPVAAADHARSPAHFAALRGVDPDQLQQLAGAAVIDASPRHRGEPWDTLWDCGITEQEVLRIDHECGLGEPLGVGFYLAVLQRRPALAWLRDMLGAGPVAEATAEWLAWTYGPADRRDPGARRAWLALGIPVRAIVGLMAANRQPDEVVRIAEHWRITTASASLLLLDWLDQGLHVTAADLTGSAVGCRAYPPRPPGRRNIAMLQRQLPEPAQASDVLAALAIVEHGSVGAAARALAE